MNLKLRSVRPHIFGGTEVYLDDVKLDGVVELVVRMGVQEPNEVSMVISVDHVDIDVETLAKLEALVEEPA